mmetsp:Transcript_1494/g.1638  ORF Transcript_1494/g.1638 Transcript_1494/m.1638 type:complete len:328 (-) Transcript_1494:16-999(-)
MSNMFKRCKIVICLSSVLLTHGTIDTHNSGKSAPIIVACVGDSITEGLAYPGQKFNLSESYPHLLQNHFNKSRYKVLNFGLGGTAIQKKSHRPFEKQKIYQDALTSNAEIIVFQFGTNDIRKFNWNEKLFKIDYIDIIERFQSLFINPVVFICIPPPVYCIDCVADIQPNISNHVLPNIIREIAYTTGAVLIDNFKNLGGLELDKPEAFYPKHKLDKKLWSNKPPHDGVHPNFMGNKYMAKLISHSIIDYMKKEKINERIYNHHRVINKNASYSMDLSDKTVSDRIHIKSDNVYDYIVNYMKFNHSAPFRPVIACVGDSITSGLGAI